MNAYEYIKNSIIQGRYKPGQRLTEEALATELSLSRTPIREAIKQLKAEGLIVPLKRGVIVRSYTKKDIKQIYDLRALLEGYAASQAAINRTNEDIERMEKTNSDYEKSINDYTQFNRNSINQIVELNKKFHDSIITATKNTLLNFHISKVIVLPLVFRSFYWYNHFQLQQSLETHKIIVEAIKHLEPDRANTAMKEHILQGRDHVLKHLINNFFKEDSL